MHYLCSKAAQHHVSEQFGSEHGETGAQHMGYNSQCKACGERSGTYKKRILIVNLKKQKQPNSEEGMHQEQSENRQWAERNKNSGKQVKTRVEEKM